MKNLYLYFAYGSNLLPSRMRRRCPNSIPFAPGILPNYRIAERLYADIDYSPGDEVSGFLYILRPGDVAMLDRYEGYPHIYKRYTVEIVLGDGSEVPAIVYEMSEETKRVRSRMRYPEEYRLICRDGARFHRIKNNFTLKRSKSK